jgi:UTP-glucose-1-phosphate uridylyltransferase
LKVIIPAAGRGQRFAVEGFSTPKELLELGGRPLIWHALDEARRAEFDTAVVVVSPSKRSLQEYLRSASLPISVEVVVQPEPLGIGDALLRAWSGDAAAVLLPDDVVTDSEHWATLLDKHNATGAATLCVRPVPIETIRRFGIAELVGDRVLRLVEKPAPGTTTSTMAIFGRYIATQAVVDALTTASPNGELELTYGFAGAITSPSGVRAVPIASRVFDCGTPSNYAASIAAFRD